MADTAESALLLDKEQTLLHVIGVLLERAGQSTVTISRREILAFARTAALTVTMEPDQNRITIEKTKRHVVLPTFKDVVVASARMTDGHLNESLFATRKH